MKSLIPGLLLICVVSCGQNSRSADKFITAEKLTCSAPENQFLALSSETIRAVENEFQGRPFNRNAFWSVLTRETRTTLNLELMSFKEMNEELLYMNTVLFFEGHLTKEKASCENLPDIETSRLIYSTDLEEELTCSVNSSTVVLHLYKNHVIIWNKSERALFARAEIIRNESETSINLRAMDPDQRSLEFKLTKKDKDVVLQFYGKTTMISGSGSCRN